MGDIPFSFFVSLLFELSKLPPRKKQINHNPCVMLFKKWIEELRQCFSPLNPGTTSIIFRLLFPEEDVDRKYGLRESGLARELVKCLGVSSKGRGTNLCQWQDETTLGCLGTEVQQVLEESHSDTNKSVNGPTVVEVDRLLNELASTCAFSEQSLRQIYSSGSRRPRQATLDDLYISLSALEASFLTQIILKDLRPLLYPLIETHYTAALAKCNSKSVTILTKEDAMRAWDESGWMLRVYHVRASLHEAANAYEERSTKTNLSSAQPIVGVMIEIPKSVKGRGCKDALKYFANCENVWSEIKYDGERTQIHVEVRDDGTSHITIFSKSKRNSTLDRFGVHEVIRNALDLPKQRAVNDKSRSPVKKNIILDAEMVAFSDRTSSIDEFWRIRSLVTGTAKGARSRMFTVSHRLGESQEEPLSQISLMSDSSDNGTRHLALVFFDVLLLDSESLLSTPYSSRRAILESVIKIRPGYSMLAERYPVNLKKTSKDSPGQQLRSIWARVIARCEEGLVLKGDEGGYNDYRSPWVKLKKDYIPGYGDTVDLVIIAACWDKDRARELRVAPNAYTAFYVGALANADAMKLDATLRPHFQVYFTVSYGLDREQLEEANFLIKSSDPLRYISSKKLPKGLPYTFDLYSGLSPPAVIFQEPLLVELFSAGFTKAPASKYYELRFPRITKLYRPSSRIWSEALNLQDLQKIAREAVGRDRTGKEADDWTKSLWGQVASPGINSELKRKEREDVWIEKLSFIDGVRVPKKVKRAECPPSPLKHCTTNIKSPLGPQGGPRTALGTKPLGAMLNVPGPLATPPPSSPTIRTPGRGSGQKEALGITFQGSPLKRQPRILMAPPVDAISPFRVSLGMGSATRLTGFGEISANKTNPKSVDPFTQVPTPPSSAIQQISQEFNSMTDLLHDSFVWFAEPCNAPRPSWRRPSRELLPPGSRLHSLESFLLGCGWGTDGHGTIRIQRGVIFVDDSTIHGKTWADFALKTLDERCSIPNNARASVWVMDMKLLRLDKVDEDLRGLAVKIYN